MHPYLYAKFGGQLHLNQKFHPNMSGKFDADSIGRQSELGRNLFFIFIEDHSSGNYTHTPQYNKMMKEYMMLQTPVQPKPPSFFEQAYLGKQDPRKASRPRSSSRPYSAYHQDDRSSYLSHHKLKKHISKQQKTIDPYHYTRTKKTNKKKQAEDEEDWERFNEELSYKSGVSRRSSKMGSRVKSAAGSRRQHHHHYHHHHHHKEGHHGKDQLRESHHLPKNIELTKQNLHNFEQKLSSQASVSRRKDKIVFSSKGDDLKTKEYKEDELVNPEGEYVDQKEEDLENPNEGDNEEEKTPDELDREAEEKIEILSKAEVQSLSKMSRKSYVESLRNELLREREKREELEKQVKELINSTKSSKMNKKD